MIAREMCGCTLLFFFFLGGVLYSTILVLWQWTIGITLSADATIAPTGDFPLTNVLWMLHRHEEGWYANYIIICIFSYLQWTIER